MIAVHDRSDWKSNEGWYLLPDTEENIQLLDVHLKEIGLPCNTEGAEAPATDKLAELLKGMEPVSNPVQCTKAYLIQMEW